VILNSPSSRTIVGAGVKGFGSIWSRKSSELGYIDYRDSFKELNLGKKAEKLVDLPSSIDYFVNLRVSQPVNYDGAFSLWDKRSNQYYEVDRFGSSNIPISDELYETNPRLYACDRRIQQLTVGIDLVVENQPSYDIDITKLLMAVDDYHEYRKAQGWIRRFFYPKLQRIEIRFADSRTMCFQGSEDDAEGPLLMPDDGGRLFIEIPVLRNMLDEISCRPNAPALVYLRSD